MNFKKRNEVESNNGIINCLESLIMITKKKNDNIHSECNHPIIFITDYKSIDGVQVPEYFCFDCGKVNIANNDLQESVAICDISNYKNEEFGINLNAKLDDLEFLWYSLEEMYPLCNQTNLIALFIAKIQEKPKTLSM